MEKTLYRREARVLALAVALVGISPAADALAAPSAYYTVTPCRVLDTREPPGIEVYDGVPRLFRVAGVCGVAQNATAVALNVTAVNPSGAGFLTLVAAGTSAGTSTLNYAAGQTRANNAVARLSSSGDMEVLASVTGSGTVHVVVDVVGYFVDDTPPVAVDDAFTVAEDAAAATIDVLANDTDVDGGNKTVGSVTQPSNGTVAIASDGASLTYQPGLDYCNTPPGTTLDTFTYTLHPGSSTATVSVGVTCVNDAPVVGATGEVTFIEGGGPVLVAPLATVTDVDGTTLTEAAVTIVNLLDTGAETLSAVTAGTSITATYTAPLLHLFGVDSLANYQAVLRSVAYENTSTNPDPTNRILAIVADDGAAISDSAPVQVAIVPANDPPRLTGSGSTPVFTEDGPPALVDAGLVVVDPDDASLESGTVTIANLLDVGAETLAASTAGTSITANYVAPTLILTGSDTVANYQAVLRSVTYANSSQDPNAAARTLFIQVVDQSLASNPVEVTVTVVPVNDPPVAAAGGAPVTFTEDGPAVIVDAGFQVTDVDDASLASATVTVTNLLDAGAETLAATTAGTAITAVYVAPSLSLAGVDTLANYQLVLRSVTYANASQNPTTTPRTLAFVANDGAAPSSPALSVIALAAVNDAPALTAGPGTPTFTEKGPPVTVDPALVAADVDSANLASATVTIGNLLDAGFETLAADTTGTSIVAAYSAPVLTLTGADTVANYQLVLRRVTYGNSSNDPTPPPRFLSFVVNDGALASSPAVKAVVVTPVADPPVLVAGGGSPTFTEDGPAVAVDPGLTVNDVDSANLVTATVLITNLADAGAEVLAANTLGTSIVANYTPPILVLIGPDTVANYQAVLRSVTYANTSSNPSVTPRLLAFTVSDGSPSNIVTTTVGLVPVNDAPALAGTGTVVFTEDAGPVAVAPGLSATDVDSPSLASASVTITNLLNAGSEFLAAMTAGTSITAAYAAPTLSLSGLDSVANYQAVLRSVSYVNLSSAPSTTDRLVVFTTNDGALGSNPAPAILQVVAVNDPLTLTNNPIAYATPGNTQLHVGSASLAGVAFVADPATALTKAAPVDIDGPVPPAVVVASGSTTAGGTYSIAADGSFTYVPPLGFAGPDSFTYGVTDSTAVVPGTVNITVGPVVWYVRDVVDASNPAGGDGRSTDAFETLPAAETASAAHSYIFVFAGNTATTPHAGGIVLKDGQKLHGEGVGLTIDPFGTIVPAGSLPRVVNASGDAVVVPATTGNRNGVEIRGLDLQASGNAVEVTSSGANSGGVLISGNSIRGAGLEAIDINAGSTETLVAVVQGNEVAATQNAIDARTTAGASLRIDVSGNQVVSGASGIWVDGSAGGGVVVNAFANNLVSGDTVGTGIRVAAATFDEADEAGLQPVTAGVTVIGAVGNGVGGSGLVLAGVAGALAFSDLDVVADGGTALLLQGTGAYTGLVGTQLTVPPSVATLHATGGAALDVSNATVDLRLSALSSSGSAGSGVSLVNVGDGSVPALFSAPVGSTIATASGTDFNVGGGNAGITYGGTIVNTAGRSVAVSGWAGDDAGDDITFSGAITGGGLGILVSGNSGSRSITFSGGLALTPVAGAIGLAATSNTNTGGLRISGTNTIDVATAAALSVSNTSIGTGGLTFQRLSANGGTNGIVLLNTGTTAGLTVTGTGAAPSGGLIQNTTGDGISLVNTVSVSLSNMTIDGADGSGIGGDDVTGFTLANSNVTNSGDTATGVEAGIRFQELLGTSAISNTVVSGSSEDNVRITPASGVLSLTISGSTIGPNSAATGGNGVTVFGTGTASATVTVTGTTFTGNRGAAFVSNLASAGTHAANVSGSTFRDNGKGVSLASNGTTDLVLNVTGNPEIVRSASNAVELLVSSDSTAAMEVRGTISGNVVGNTAADSGSRDLHGIAVDLRGDARTILNVSSNSVRHVDFMGIFIQDADFGASVGSSSTDLTVRDNSVQDIDDNSPFPCGAPYGTLVDIRHDTLACMDMAGNLSAQSPVACVPPPLPVHFRLRQRDTSVFRLERLTDGDATPGELIADPATVEAFVVAQNDPGSTANAVLSLGFTEAPSGACVKP